MSSSCSEPLHGLGIAALCGSLLFPHGFSPASAGACFCRSVSAWHAEAEIPSSERRAAACMICQVNIDDN